MTDKPLTDFTGTTIECGDTILYAVKDSTICRLNLAKVAEITTFSPGWGGPAPMIVAEWLMCSSGWQNERRVKGEQVRLTALDNILVIEKASKESHPEWAACRRG